MIEKRIVNWKSRTVLFLISQCVTLFGSTLVQMAIVWYVTLNTSSGVWVAAFSICSYLPQFLMSFIGGVWADRYSRKRLIIGADISIAAVTFIMMLAMPFIREEKFLLGGLLVMSIIRSVGAGIQTPAVNAVIPQLVPESQLMRFNGINATMQSLVQFAAPAAAGLLLSLSTLQSTLIIDILTAVFGVGILSCVLIPKQRSIEKSASVIKDMRMGIHFAFSDKLIRKLLIVYGLFTFLCVPAGFLAGLLVNRVYGNTYWYLTAVELIGFFGMIMGGLLMSLWRGFKSLHKYSCIWAIYLRNNGCWHGIDKKIYIISYFNGIIRCCSNDSTNFDYNIDSRKCEKLNARPYFRINGIYVFWLYSDRNGDFWTDGRYNSFRMDYSMFRSASDDDCNDSSF